MRTLKKALCVVLCLVMMAGLCVIGTNAAFTDADEINYKEAVEVLTGIGVIRGMGDGSFAPKGTLTRAQACTIVAYLLKEEDLKGTNTFTDCQDHWGKDYIAICENKGIVAGYGDGTFGPDDTLKGAQFAIMLLRALGYKDANEGMTGDTWELGVASLVKKLKLAAGLKAFDGTAPITREEACQLAFNALFTEEVSYPSSGTTISTGDVTITTGGGAAQGTGDYLAELFNLVDATDDAAPDAYGRPAVQAWAAGKPSKTIYTEYEEAAWSYTNKTGTPVDPDALKAAYAKEAGLKASAVSMEWPDGSDFSDSVYPGWTYEFSASADGKTLTYLTSYFYVAAKITDVKDTADTDAEYKKDIYYAVFGSEQSEPVHETDLTVEVKKGDWVAAPVCFYDGPVLEDVVVMEGVNGKMSAVNDAKGTATIGGTKLAISNMFYDADNSVYGKDFASTLTYYTDPNGLLLVAEVYEEAFTYDEIVGYSLKFQSRSYKGDSSSTDLLGNTSGEAAKEGRAVCQILDMDGTVTVYDLAVKQDAKNEKTTFIGKGSYFTGEVGDVNMTTGDFITYYKNDDGTIVVTDIIGNDYVETDKADYEVYSYDQGTQKANSNTVLHIVHEKGADGKYATETITGYKNFKDAEYDYAYMVVDKGYITDIYAVNVPTTPVVIAPTLGYCKEIGEDTADGTNVIFVVDGKEETYVIEDIDAPATYVDAGKYYKLTVEDGKVTKATEATPDVNDAVVTAVDPGFVDTDPAGVIQFLKNTKTYDISGKSLTLAKGVKIDVFALTEDDMIIFIVGK